MCSTGSLPPPERMLPHLSVSLISYGHANGPLVQPERERGQRKLLAYNIRHLPNPPRHLRANSTGLSRRLQKEFLQNDAVQAQLCKAQHEVVETLKVEPDSLVSWPSIPERPDLERHPARREKIASLDKNDHGSNVDLSLVVTVCCEEGRHRSVAFVEELARRLAGFKNGDGGSRTCCLDVSVTHRDINISTPRSDESGFSEKQACGMNSNTKSQRKSGRRKGAVLGGAFNDFEDD